MLAENNPYKRFVLLILKHNCRHGMLRALLIWICLASSTNAFNARLASDVVVHNNNRNNRRLQHSPRLIVTARSMRRCLQRKTKSCSLISYPRERQRDVTTLRNSADDNDNDDGDQPLEDSLEGEHDENTEGSSMEPSEEEHSPKEETASKTPSQEEDTVSSSIIPNKANRSKTTDDQSKQEQSRAGRRFLTTYSKWAGETINGAAPTKPPTILSHWKELTQLTRPINFPGICLFHMLGVYLALDHAGELSQYGKVLLCDPAMFAVLTALILTSSTSMVVNDYFDTKLGRDTDPSNSALVSGELPMYLVRRYLSYLYAAALVCAAFLPGVPARLSVVLALMLTYWYTKYLKPITWLKNAVCAALIAFSPFTSGSAALFRTSSQNLEIMGKLIKIPALWRLVAVLFVGFVGREMTMDCNDVQDDAAVGVQTVPVHYGTRFASKIAFLCSGAVALLSSVVPALEAGRLYKATTDVSIKSFITSNIHPLVRLGLALLGSSMLLLRSWQVVKSEGRNPKTVDRAVQEGLVSVLFILGSFV